MKNAFLYLLLLGIAMSSCQNENLELIPTHEDNLTVDSREYYDDYSDDMDYSLDEFLQLNHNEYGDNFIAQNINSITDNIESYGINEVKGIATAAKKIKFRFRWNGCDPLGACLIIPLSVAPNDPDLTTSLVAVKENKLFVFPKGAKQGMLSDGYIFVDPIQLDEETCGLLGVPYGSSIKPGIYTSSLPSKDFKYGYHIFDLK